MPDDGMPVADAISSSSDSRLSVSVARARSAGKMRAWTVGSSEENIFSKNVFRRAESHHRLGIFRSDDGINTCLQRRYERWTECAQIHLALRRSQFASGIEQIVLHSDIGRVHVDIVVKAYIVEQTVDARRIFVDIDVFVPFDACYKFAVIYLWHPLYREHHEHGHAHRQDEAYSRHADGHMAEAPVNDTRVHTVEPCVDLGSRLPFMGGACGGVVSAFA